MRFPNVSPGRRPKGTRFLLTVLAMAANCGIAFAQIVDEESTVPGDITAEATDTSSADEATARYPQIKAAFELFANREFKNAEDLLKKACTEHAELPPAGVIIGTWYFTKAKAPTAARAAYERAVRDTPGDPEAYVVFGDNAIQQRRFTDAYLLYRKAKKVLERYDANAKRRKNLGIRADAGLAAVLEAREQWEDAEASLRSVLLQDEDNLVVLSRLARSLYKQEKEQEAYDIFKQMHSIDPKKSGRYEILMARLYQQAGKDKNAEKLFGIALDKDPDTLNTQLAAATWALETGRIDLAKKAVGSALKIEPDNVQVRLVEGIIARTQNDYVAAENAFRAALAKSPSNGAVLNQLAIALASQDDEEKRKQAIEFAQMGTRLFANARNAIGRETGVTLAWVLFRLDRKSQAQKQLQTALQAGAVTGDAAFMAAEIFHAAGQSDVSERLLQSAIEQSRGIFPMKAQAEALLQKIRGLDPAPLPK